VPDKFLAGKHAVVTGGSRGIGAACARMLAAHGARMTLMGRDRDALGEVSASIPDSATVVCDVTDDAAVTKAFADAHARGPISILVNNAGMAESAPFLKTSDELLARMFDVNVLSAFRCTRASLTDMQAAGWGRVVNISSIAGLKGGRYISAYVASKHALVGFTRALAAEVAGKGITVNAVCPGYVDTDMTKRTIANIVARTKMSEEKALAEIARGNATGKLLSPEEVAEEVLFLCGPESNDVNGQAIAIGDIA
jgi:NAD(P)-dependent dehydrogenase (short-subunit alcohol dehydrogenase family)